MCNFEDPKNTETPLAAQSSEELTMPNASAEELAERLNYVSSIEKGKIIPRVEIDRCGGYLEFSTVDHIAALGKRTFDSLVNENKLNTQDPLHQALLAKYDRPSFNEIETYDLKIEPPLPDGIEMSESIVVLSPGVFTQFGTVEGLNGQIEFTADDGSPWEFTRDNQDPIEYKVEVRNYNGKAVETVTFSFGEDTLYVYMKNSQKN